MTVAVVYETHSTSEDNEAGRATGWLDGRLSEAGRKQAAQLGERRRDDGLAAIYVSDLGRAVETARRAFGDGFVLDARLRECDYGELNGMPLARFELERPQRVDDPYPGGESYRDVVARVESLLADIRRRHDGERVLLISHAAPKWALDHLLRGVPLEQLVHAPFDWRPGWEYQV
jgi:broad specificity phosphatase PhoE